MGEVAMTEFQNQIEALRREAFAEGYAAAMQSVRELASRSAPQSAGTTAVLADADESHAEQPEDTKAAMPLSANSPVRRSGVQRSTAQRIASSPRRPRRRRAKRGANAQMIQEILKKAAPRAVRQAEIRRSLEERGVLLPYPSIGHALGQLK